MTKAVVTGATGQDARYLVPMLVERGYEVVALARDVARAQGIHGGVQVERADVAAAPEEAAETIARVAPDVIFNLAGHSSVSESFVKPMLTWQTNANWPATLLELVRTRLPEARLYQASSSEMFGCLPGEAVVHNETSPFRPQSPYAASKAAAHLLCGIYRQSYGVRVACGILFNHESRHRGEAFLTTKISRHVAALRKNGSAEPLRVGRLDSQRDWGFARDYARGILLIAEQIATRSRRAGRPIEDIGVNYRDYVLGTGVPSTVKDLIDRAFALAGFPLDWTLEEGGRGRACFAGTDEVAVESVPEFYRAAEPLAIQADASRAFDDLGWRAGAGPDLFLQDMIDHAGEAR